MGGGGVDGRQAGEMGKRAGDARVREEDEDIERAGENGCWRRERGENLCVVVVVGDGTVLSAVDELQLAVDASEYTRSISSMAVPTRA